MDPATPFLFGHRPARLPIRKTIVAIVGICRPWRQYRLHWWKNRLHWWKNDLRRRSGWWATAVMNPTTPLFLVRCPSVLGIDSAVEWVHWSSRCSRGRWRRRRWRGWRRCWERRRRDGNWGGRQSCGRATPAHGHAAVIFLCLGPHSVIGADWATYSAVEWLGGAGARQQPEEQRQQQETQKTAARDEASKIPPRPHDVEVTSKTDILVCGFLDVLSLPSANIR